MVAFVKAKSDAQSQWAVYALACLAFNNKTNCTAVVDEGAITSLVQLITVRRKAEKQWAAYTLGILAVNDANRVKITVEGAIKPLVTLLRSGTGAQKRWVVYAVGNLVCTHVENSAAKGIKEAIIPLRACWVGSTETNRG